MNPTIMQALGAEHVREMHKIAEVNRQARRVRQMSRSLAGIGRAGGGLTRRRDGMDHADLLYVLFDLTALDRREAWEELEGRTGALR